jgi:hypothetical protein
LAGFGAPEPTAGVPDLPSSNCSRKKIDAAPLTRGYIERSERAIAAERRPAA